MPSDAPSSADANFDGYVQRAALLADLGRYDDAVTELQSALSFRADDAQALTLLARVYLAALRPEPALAAADAAAAAAPDQVAPLVVRGHALIDLNRFAEAAQTAEQLLALGPDDGYALRSAAAILSESRNGQEALNIAWRAVEVAPEEPQSHLVLSLVAARLGLFDLAERAYREALRLDPTLGDAPQDVGVIGLERRRYATDLAYVAESTVVRAGTAGGPPTTGNTLVRFVLHGAGYTLVTAVLVAFAAAVHESASRAWAAVLAVVGLVVVGVSASRLPGQFTATLSELLRRDLPMGLAAAATVAGPVLLMVYTLFGTPWPLVAAIAVAAVAELIVLTRHRV